MLGLKLDKYKNIPYYRQLTEQIISLIEKGMLKKGVHLPSSRSLAESLKINRTTVYKAYRELWSLGYIESRPGSYSIVRDRKNIVTEKSKKERSALNWKKITNDIPDISSEKFRNNRVKFDFRPISPDPRIIPKEDFRRCLNDVLKEKGEELLMYGNPAGYLPLREYISELLYILELSPKFSFPEYGQDGSMETGNV